MAVNIEPETREVLRAIEAVTDPLEFSAVLAALEAALARRIMREAEGSTHPFWAEMAGGLVASHVMGLLGHEDLLDG